MSWFQAAKRRRLAVAGGGEGGWSRGPAPGRSAWRRSRDGRKRSERRPVHCWCTSARAWGQATQQLHRNRVAIVSTPHPPQHPHQPRAAPA